MAAVDYVFLLISLPPFISPFLSFSSLTLYQSLHCITIFQSLLGPLHGNEAIHLLQLCVTLLVIMMVNVFDPISVPVSMYAFHITSLAICRVPKWRHSSAPDNCTLHLCRLSIISTLRCYVRMYMYIHVRTYILYRGVIHLGSMACVLMDSVTVQVSGKENVVVFVSLVCVIKSMWKD